MYMCINSTKGYSICRSGMYKLHYCILLYVTEQKPDIFAYKLKFILLPQLIAVLNNFACSLLPLANVNWSVFPECFLLNLQIHNW